MILEGDLDVFLDGQGPLCRVEVSTTLHKLAKVLSTRTASGKTEISYYERHGLGVWRAFGLVTGKFGNIYFAGPEGEHEAGCSIWFKPRNGHSKADVLELSLFAEYITELLYPLKPMFALAETGQIIQQPSELRKAARRIMNRPNSRVATRDLDYRPMQLH